MSPIDFAALSALIAPVKVEPFVSERSTELMPVRHDVTGERLATGSQLRCPAIRARRAPVAGRRLDEDAGGFVTLTFVSVMTPVELVT